MTKNKKKPKLLITKKKFKAIRESLGMSQEEFAAKLGYGGRTIIYMKESGKRALTLKDQIMLQDYL